MTGQRGYLTLSGLLLSYALFLGLGWLVAGPSGVWVSAALATALWVWAIVRAGKESGPNDRRRG